MVEQILKQSIASFYGTDFGRCLESFENMQWSRDEQRRKMQMEHKGVVNRRYVIRFGIRCPIPAQFIYCPSDFGNLHASVMPQTKAIVSIENVVASASINQRVDLNLITKNFVDVEYHPDSFQGLSSD